MKAGSRDFGWVAAAYLAAVLVAYLVAQEISGSPLMRAFWADIAATLVIFGFSRRFGNSSFYDAYWSVAPPLLFVYWMLQAGQADLRSLLLFLLVFAWAVRLTYNWAEGWQGLEHQDWRYVDLEAKTGRWYPLVDLLGIQLLPTLLVFLGCLPLYHVVSAPGSPLGIWDVAWILVGGGSLYLEFRADNVLRGFRRQPAPPGTVLTADVWGWCRHPNYLGELGFWLSLGMAGYVADESLLNAVGFVAMVCLFVFISIPMIEKRQLASKPDYLEYKRRVFSLLPTPPGNARKEA